MLGEEGGKDASGVHEHGDDVFLKKIESHLLTQASPTSGHNNECLIQLTNLMSMSCQLLDHSLELQRGNQKHS